MIDWHRWALGKRHDIPDLADPQATYLTRWRLVQTPWFGVYLHAIRLPDTDRHLHDHPWDFASVVLAGGYTEELVHEDRGTRTRFVGPHRRGSDGMLRPTLKLRWRRRTNVKRAHVYHRVQRLTRTPTWTLALTGPRRPVPWGYRVPLEVPVLRTGRPPTVQRIFVHVPNDEYHARWRPGVSRPGADTRELLDDGAV